MKSEFDVGEPITVGGQRIGHVHHKKEDGLTLARDKGIFNPTLTGMVVMLKQDVFSVKAANGKRLYLDHVCTDEELNIVDDTEKEPAE